jgi:hypothetical protein
MYVDLQADILHLNFTLPLLSHLCRRISMQIFVLFLLPGTGGTHHCLVSFCLETKSVTLLRSQFHHLSFYLS